MELWSFLLILDFSASQSRAMSKSFFGEMHARNIHKHIVLKYVKMSFRDSVGFTEKFINTVGRNVFRNNNEDTRAKLTIRNY